MRGRILNVLLSFLPENFFSIYTVNREVKSVFFFISFSIRFFLMVFDKVICLEMLNIVNL